MQVGWVECRGERPARDGWGECTGERPARVGWVECRGERPARVGWGEGRVAVGGQYELRARAHPPPVKAFAGSCGSLPGKASSPSQPLNF